MDRVLSLNAVMKGNRTASFTLRTAHLDKQMKPKPNNINQTDRLKGHNILSVNTTIDHNKM